MIAAVQPADARARYRFGMQLEMRQRCDLVRAAMIEKDGNPYWKASRKVRPELDVFARPSARANEGSCDQEDAPCLSWRPLGENIDENRSADRVADENGARPERGEFGVQHRLPNRISWIGLVRHG